MWLGLDLGTQSAKAIVASETGCVLAASSQPLTSRRDGNRHEQDPHQWWRAIVTCCREVLAQVPRRDLKGVAVDGTSGTILLMSKVGEPLTPGVMYDDSRAQEEVCEVNRAGATVWQLLGYRMQPSWALPKLLWLLRNTAVVRRGVRLAHQADFINTQLAGCEIATDWTNALKTGYDLINDCWPSKVLECLGIPREMFPSVVSPGTQIGEVCREVTEMTGIPEGTPLVAGLTDGCASQIAAGALHEESGLCVLGTTLVVKGVTKQLLRDTAGVVYSHRLAEDNWLPGGASNAGAGAIARRFHSEELERLGKVAATRPATKVLTYPLVSRGERFPFSAQEAEEFVIGEPSDDVEMYSSLLQGAAFVARLSFDYLMMLGAKVNDLALTGGATRNMYCASFVQTSFRRPFVCRRVQNRRLVL